MKTHIFSYRNYKSYFKDLIQSHPNRGRGLRKFLAEAMHCQVTYVTHVLNGGYHFSPEQGEAAARFFGLSRDETEFLIHLIMYNRAGTEELKVFYEVSLQEREQKNGKLNHRLKIRGTVTREDQAVYYSSWHYCAVHILLTVPRFNTRDAIAEALKLSRGKTAQILHFLTDKRLVEKRGNSYYAIQPLLHLEDESPLISKHHANWRVRAIQALDEVARTDLHYSSVFSCSEKDLPIVREKLTRCLEECTQMIRSSPEERVASLCIDLFRI